MLNPATGEFYENMTKAVINEKTYPQNLKPTGLMVKLSRRNSFTPDFHALKKFKTLPIFVYGQEMIDGPGARFLEGSRRLGMAHTLSSSYLMKHTTVQPVVFSVSDTNKQRKKIRGEVYEITMEHLYSLDTYHRNSYQMRRVPRKIVFEDTMPANAYVSRTKPAVIHTAFMYLGLTAFWNQYELKRDITKRHVRKVGIDPNEEFYSWVNIPPEIDDEWGFGNRWGRFGDMD